MQQIRSQRASWACSACFSELNCSILENNTLSLHCFCEVGLGAGCDPAGVSATQVAELVHSSRSSFGVLKWSPPAWTDGPQASVASLAPGKGALGTLIGIFIFLSPPSLWSDFLLPLLLEPAPPKFTRLQLGSSGSLPPPQPGSQPVLLDSGPGIEQTASTTGEKKKKKKALAARELGRFPWQQARAPPPPHPPPTSNEVLAKSCECIRVL